MTTLVIDTEPSWLAYWRKKGADTYTFIPDATTLALYDKVIISDRMAYASLPPGFVVATSYASVEGAIMAYGAGASDYITKDFK